MPYLLLIGVVFLAIPFPTFAESPPLRYWKGNLHTHSLWSDGDEFPEMIADWYRERDYNFLAITDHNVVSRGVRWMSEKAIIKRSDDGVVDRYLDRFGNHWVETRKNDSGETEVRLKPLDEFRALVEERNRFILIQAEEVTNVGGGKPVHINATNIAEKIPPVSGPSVREVMEIVLRAIHDHGEKHGREVLPHINHPNFHYAITAEDLAAVVSEPFFEVYNGHPGVNHLGDDDHPSVETMWDLANAIRLNDLNAEPLMGIATDDSHEYHGRPGSRPGRGWVMVRSRFLTPEHLVKAMKRGDFYSSSGVSLQTVVYDEKQRRLSVEIAPHAAATYTTQFVGVRKGDYEASVFATVEGRNASYSLEGDELYVRAVVTSSLEADDPSYNNQKRQAWTQPVGWSIAQAPVNAPANRPAAKKTSTSSDPTTGKAAAK